MSEIMRSVARDVILPRYRNLAAHEVMEKAADDLVTIADHESEQRLTEGLLKLLPEAGVVGEEACAADPRLIKTAGQGLKWIIDPIDGTGNFAAGHAPFGVMIALADNGETIAGWLLDPLTDRLCHAGRSMGATIDGKQTLAKESGADLPIAGISTLFMDPTQREALLQLAEGQLHLVDIPRCAAEQYPRIVLGINDFAIFSRTLPWDHAAGVLFLNEAGGRATRHDGTPYVLNSDDTGMLAAASPRLWDKAAEILFS